MARFEITGGNGRGATLEQISAGIKAAGGERIDTRRAFGWSNQPEVCTFAARDQFAADAICKKACGVIWPGDSSIMANLLCWPYGKESAS